MRKLRGPPAAVMQSLYYFVESGVITLFLEHYRDIVSEVSFILIKTF